MDQADSFLSQYEQATPEAETPPSAEAFLSQYEGTPASDFLDKYAPAASQEGEGLLPGDNTKDNWKAFKASVEYGWKHTITGGAIRAGEQMYTGDEEGPVAPDPETGEIEGEDTFQPTKQEQQAYKERIRAKQAREDQRLEATMNNAQEGILGAVSKYGGLVAGSLADPVGALTFAMGGAGGKSVIELARLGKLAVAGGGYEAGANSLEQLNKAGAVTDWKELAGRTALGAVMAPGMDIALRGVGRGISEVWKGKTGRTLTKLNREPDAVFTNKEMDILYSKHEELGDAIVAARASGLEPLDAIAAAEQHVGGTPEQTMLLANATGRDFHIPVSVEEAQRAWEMSLPERAFKDPNLAKELLQATSDIIDKVDPRITTHVRKHDMEMKMLAAEWGEGTTPLARQLKRLRKADPIRYANAQSSLRNGKFDFVKREFDAVGIDVRKELASHVNVMKRIEKEYKGVYSKFKAVENFAPRVIKDKEGFLNALGREERTFLQNRIAQQKHNLKRDLTDVEYTKVIHDALFQKGSDFHKKNPHVMFRKWKEIPSGMDAYYAPYEEAMGRYLYNTVKDVGVRRLFGKFGVAGDATHGIDIDKSISKYIAEHWEIPPDTQRFRVLQNALQAYAFRGQMAPRRSLQHIRNLTYGLLLGNPISATVQLKDVGMAAARSNLVNTAKAIFGKKYMDATVLGINHAAAELEHNPSWSATVSEKMLLWGGFKKADLVGKNIIINAALRKLETQATSAKGLQKMSQRWERELGPEGFEDAVKAIKAKDWTNKNIKLMMFHELSDTQPISHLEMPLRWLNHPDGRLFYTLHTFPLRQVNTVIKDTVRAFHEGKGGARGTYEAAKKLTGYAISLGMAGATVDQITGLMKGRPLSMKDWVEGIGDNMIQAAMLDRYTVTKAYDKGLEKTAYDYAFSGAQAYGAPVVSLVDDMYKTIKRKEDVKDWKFIRSLGAPGAIWYYWVGGGYEKAVKNGGHVRKKGIVKK